MNRAELIDAIAGDLDIPKSQAGLFLDALGSRITTVLVQGGDVLLPDVGKLSVTHRVASEGRNPRTGAPLKIAAKRIAKFRAVKALRDALHPPAPSVPRRA